MPTQPKLKIIIPSIRNESNPFFEHLKSFEKIVIFSSHLDDAVLSMGSLISYLVKGGKEVEICSVFTQGKIGTSESIKIILSRANFITTREYISARKNEDEKTLNFLGVSAFHRMDFLDAAWRTGLNNRHLYPNSQVGTIDPQDKEVLKKLEKKVKVYTSKFSKAIFFSPLARGLHIDHQLTRDAVKNTIKKIIYYEDFPYSSKFEDVDSFISENKLKRYIWAGDFEMKRKAIFMYGTQTESFIAFGNGTLELTPENFYST